MQLLLSIAQMPGGVPVGTLAIGKSGAANAAWLAAAILATSDAALAGRLRRAREQMAAKVEANENRVTETRFAAAVAGFAETQRQVTEAMRDLVKELRYEKAR